MYLAVPGFEARPYVFLGECVTHKATMACGILSLN